METLLVKCILNRLIMIIIKNKKAIRHGYREFKYSNGKPWHKYTFNNGILFGYVEWYHTNGKIDCKEINI